MRGLSREVRPWFHGVAATLIGIVALLMLMALPNFKRLLVDGMNIILYYPEKPAFELRNIVKFSSNWVLERKSLQERVTALEMKNFQMSAALQKSHAGVSEARQGYVGARVTLRYPERWWQEIRIDKGLNSGVTDGAAVMSEGHLIGRVASSGLDYAWVELITSSSFLIAAAVDETRDLGVINGDDSGNLRLLYVPEERKLKTGMTVSTSLMNDQIPPGVPIGTVLGSGEIRDGFIEMKIKAGAHLTQLYNVDVFVVKKAVK